MQQRRHAHQLAALVVLALAAAQPRRAHGRGILAEDSIAAADTRLAAKSKGRKSGPASSVGPLPTGLAWDGTTYWSAAGGDVATANLLQWCTNGSCIKQHGVPELDVRSVWTTMQEQQTQGPHKLYAAVFGSEDVYEHTGGGKLATTGITLHGAERDIDSPVIWRPADPVHADDPPEGVLVARDNAGEILEFSGADGGFIRDVSLRAFGAESGETDWPNYVRFSVAQVADGLPGQQFVYLTYAGGRVHAWDRDGKRAGDATLEGAPDDEHACHSFSYANGRAWLRDSSGAWHGFKLAFAAVPPPSQEDTAAAAARAQQSKSVRPEDALTQSAGSGDDVCPIATE